MRAVYNLQNPLVIRSFRITSAQSSLRLDEIELYENPSISTQEWQGSGGNAEQGNLARSGTAFASSTAGDRYAVTI